MLSSIRRTSSDGELHKSVDPLPDPELPLASGNGEVIGTGEEFERCGGRVGSWFRWRPTSKAILNAVEKRILSYLKTPYKGQYVNIGPVVGKKDNEIWTLSHTENEPDKTPIVLVHGFASGVGMWALNLDELAESRPVYAIDLLGFARSSRPVFSTCAEEAEKQMVQSIEEWRSKMNIDRFVLVGHSFGGFLSSSYAIQHPERVSHLVLADPWGFNEKPANLEERYPLRWWVKMIASIIQPLGINPLSAMRAAGPWGPKIIGRARGDLDEKFSKLSDKEDVNISEYIYHCNAQRPTGEAVFHTCMSDFAWAKNPMIRRINTLPPHMPVTFLNGSRSWIDHCPPEMIKAQRPDSFVEINVLQNGSHHVYADNHKEFNELVLKAADFGDEIDKQMGIVKKSDDNNPSEINKSVDESEISLKLINVASLS